MNAELFIARRIYKGDKKNDKRVSSPAIKIAIAGIALGLAVMIVSVCIIVGFKKRGSRQGDRLRFSHSDHSFRQQLLI